MKNTFDVFSTKFAQDIFLQKYSKDGLETWAETAKRVTEAVCSQLLDSKTKEKIYFVIFTDLFEPLFLGQWLRNPVLMCVATKRTRSMGIMYRLTNSDFIILFKCFKQNVL